MAIIEGVLMILFTLCILYMAKRLRQRDAENAALTAQKQTAGNLGGAL